MVEMKPVVRRQLLLELVINVRYRRMYSPCTSNIVSILSIVVSRITGIVIPLP